MDTRWYPVKRDSIRDAQIVLHPTASINEVRVGLTEASDDSVDLTPFVSQASHTQFDATVQLSFNREFFGANQPRPNQILEIKLKQGGGFQTLWIGIIDAISSFTMSRGERSLQLSAKSRDSTELWRGTKRLTPLFPQMTDLGYIAHRIAMTAGLTNDEIVLPATGLTTPHSNTQLADMSAWDMITAVFVPCGWTPFIDSLGRLRPADRQIQGRFPDIILSSEQVVRIGASRQKPPATRVRVSWLNPTLKKAKQQDRSLTQVTMTLGWWLPYWHHEFYFSDDKTQRAENTRINWGTSKSANLWTKIKFCSEDYEQTGENKGKMTWKNIDPVFMAAAIASLILTQANTIPTVGLITVPPAEFGAVIPVPSPGTYITTAPAGRAPEIAATILFMAALLLVGTGHYDIWGTPYEWVHARNVTEAFDQSAPLWVDNYVDVNTDFIVNEPHAQAVAVRELIYQARAASKWTATIVDDPRIEMGDIVKFPDGTQMYVEDFSRRLDRGSEATLDVHGFTLSGSAGIGGSIAGGVVPPAYGMQQPPSGPGGPGTSPDEPTWPTQPFGAYEVNSTHTWSDSELLTRVKKALAAAPADISDDDPSYWTGVIRDSAPDPDNWEYWVYQKMLVPRSHDLSEFGP